ncbi:hypothetical protein ACVI1N_000017 [Sinorhizobium medicae]
MRSPDAHDQRICMYLLSYLLIVGGFSGVPKEASQENRQLAANSQSRENDAGAPAKHCAPAHGKPFELGHRPYRLCAHSQGTRSGRLRCARAMLLLRTRGRADRQLPVLAATDQVRRAFARGERRRCDRDSGLAQVRPAARYFRGIGGMADCRPAHSGGRALARHIRRRGGPCHPLLHGPAVPGLGHAERRAAPLRALHGDRLWSGRHKRAESRSLRNRRRHRRRLIRIHADLDVGPDHRHPFPGAFLAGRTAPAGRPFRPDERSATRHYQAVSGSVEVRDLSEPFAHHSFKRQ